jgi:dienelactone hydrolase
MSLEFCDDCFTGSILPGEGKGEIATIGRFSTYVAQPTIGEREPRKDVAVVYCCDAFGLAINNNKIIPDKLADALQCTVYVPDLLEGDYPPIGGFHIIDRPMAQESIWYKIVQYFKLVSHLLFGVGPRWMIRHSRNKMQPLTEEFVKTLREEKQLKKIGIIGYCMGGVQSCALAGTDLVETAVVAHPAPLTKEDFEKVKVPISFICAEEDLFFSVKYKNMAEEILRGKTDFPSEFITYKGTTHGFAARPNMGIPEVKEGFHSAFDQAVNWFKLHLLNA